MRRRQVPDPPHGSVWREALDRMDEELVVWSRTHRKANGVDWGRRKPDIVDPVPEDRDEAGEDIAIREAA